MISRIDSLGPSARRQVVFVGVFAAYEIGRSVGVTTPDHWRRRGLGGLSWGRAWRLGWLVGLFDFSGLPICHHGPGPIDCLARGHKDFALVRRDEADIDFHLVLGDIVQGAGHNGIHLEDLAHIAPGGLVYHPGHGKVGLGKELADEAALNDLDPAFLNDSRGQALRHYVRGGGWLLA